MREHLKKDAVEKVNSDTVYTGKNAKELQEKAKQVAETGNILKFFLILKQE